MPDIQLPGIRLYYEEKGSGAPIVLIHGTSSSGLVWASAVEELARLGRVIAYDRRGCYRSERPNPYTTNVREHGDDAAALIDALGAAPAIVIGRSYGGHVATDLALRYPERVRALVLLEGASSRLVPEARKWEEEIVNDLRALADTRGVDYVAEAFLRTMLGDGAWEAFPPEYKAMFRGNGEAILAEIAGGDLDVDPAALALIQQPTLLVSATDSPEVFRRANDVMAAAMPSARGVLVDGGHMISPTEPEVSAFVREMLGR